MNRRAFILGAGASVAVAIPLAKSIAQSKNMWPLAYQAGPEKFSAQPRVYMADAIDVIRQMQNMPQHANCRCVLYWKDETYDVGRGEWPSA